MTKNCTQISAVAATPPVEDNNLHVVARAGRATGRELGGSSMSFTGAPASNEPLHLPRSLTRPLSGFLFVASEPLGGK